MHPTLFSFFEHAPRLSFPKKHIFIHPLKPITHVFYLEKGFIRMYSVSSTGNETTVLIFKPGSLIPLALIFAHQENVFYFQGTTNTTVYKESAEKFLQFLENNPHLSFQIINRLSLGLYGLSVRIGELLHTEIYSRLISLLIYFAEKFGETKGTKKIIQLPITHLDIAAWLGTSRETVTRQLANLKKKRLITIKAKQVTILNVEQLHKELKNPLSALNF